MALAVSMFRWLELLEKEFDKAFVEIDVMLGEIDPDQMEITQAGRQKLTAMSSSFAQLAHKSQTIFQTNAKMEAELISLRTTMTEAQAKVDVLEKELKNTLLQLHAVQLQLHSSGENTPDSDVIKLKLENELTTFRRDAMKESLLQAQSNQYEKENGELRIQLAQLQGEVYGARLAAKYLDKELAGRIQQIQLLGRDLKQPEHDSLWNQIEAEVHLHRHKTVIRACRKKKSLEAPPKLVINEDDDQDTVKRKNRGIGDPRLVRLHRDKSEGLGVSITGGKEHGVPVIISEIHEDMPAERCKELFVGDAILSVNNIDLHQASHQHAVHVLSRVHGDIVMEVMYVDVDDSDDEDNWEEDETLRYSTVGVTDDPNEMSKDGEVFMTNSPSAGQRKNKTKDSTLQSKTSPPPLQNGISNKKNNTVENHVSASSSMFTTTSKSVPSTPTGKYPGTSRRILSSEDVPNS